MIDVVYVVTTVCFFALMLLYVRGCDRMARGHDGDGSAEDRP